MGNHAQQASRSRRLVVHAARGDRRRGVGRRATHRPCETTSASSVHPRSIRSRPSSPSSSAAATRTSRRRRSSRRAAAAASRRSAAASASSIPTSRTRRAASRPSEVADCSKNGVTEIVEVKIGYDGIVLANAKSAPHYQVTLRDIYLALAKNVPDPAGAQKLVPNPYTTWSRDQLDSARRRDRGARPAADVGHARRVQRARHGGRLQDVRVGRGAAARRVPRRVPHAARRRPLRRGRRERQPDRAEARGEPARSSASSATASSSRTRTRCKARTSTAWRRTSTRSPTASIPSRGRSTST